MLVEALKEILTDANFEFDANGIKVMAYGFKSYSISPFKTVNKNFEFYKLSREKITVGINMINLFKLIKTMDNNDTLSLFIEEDNESVLGIKLENIEKNTRTKYSLNLMDLHEENIHCPPAEFESVITMPSRFPENLS